MLEDGKILIGKSAKPEYLTLRLANRHGLVTGATGTGKTVTLQVLAEGFSNAGVPVFAADIKGDLSGVAQPGDGKPPFVKRAQEIGIEYTPDRFPVAFWDLFGEQGHPIRATVSEMGPLLLARLLELNDVQEGVLNIAFRVADDANLPVLDLKDLRALLNFVVENADTVSAKYGNVAKASVASVQRQLLMLENQGADKFFGEPALNLQDFMKTDRDGRGIINILAADKLMTKPRLYASFLLWMLSELFEALPEVGDLDKPKLVFFFDEAHLLFNDAPKPLLDAVEQVVRLIRSKGVGVYFVTQNPLDVPQTVLAQLGNRAQHALRAFTPRDQKAVRAAAETFRQNPAFDTAKVIMELAVGEALVSTLEERGTPSIVERTLIAPPTARVGPVTDAERKAIVQASALRGKYEAAVDSESAYEMLAKRKQMAEQPAQEASTSGGLGGILGKITDALGGGSQPQAQQPGKGKGAQRMSTTEVIIRSMATSAARSVGTQITRAVLRNVLGGILGSAAGGGGGGGGRRRASRAADLDSGGQGGSGDFMGDMSDLIQGGGRRSGVDLGSPSCAGLTRASRCEGCASPYDRSGRARPPREASMPHLDQVLADVDKDLDNSLQRLFQWLRIPSISTDPAYAKDCRRAAEWLKGDLEAMGFEASLRDTPGHPVVLAHAPKPGAPHVLFYGHYDVQPVDPRRSVGDAALRAADGDAARTGARSSARAAPATTRAR